MSDVYECEWCITLVLIDSRDRHEHAVHSELFGEFVGFNQDGSFR
jgi:hypothetical protein